MRSQLGNKYSSNGCWFYGIIHDKRYLSASFYYTLDEENVDKNIINITFDTLSRYLSVYEQGSYTQYPKWYSCIEDMDTHKVFVNADIGGTHGIYQYLNVSQPQFGVVTGGDDYLLASKTKAYRWSSDGSIYQLNNSSLVTSQTRPALMQSACMIMDDDDHLWFMDGSSIKAFDINSGLTDKNLDTLISGNPLLVNVGLGFILAVIDGDYIKYYLVS